MERIGVIGGTFDPIHLGHLIAAQWAQCELKLDKVIFVPAAIPPHKDNDEVLDQEYRYNMVKLATKSNEKFEVSDIELQREGSSYTVDTLKHFGQIYPKTQLFFIMGLDALLGLDTWKDVDELIELANFVVTTRPGYIIKPHDEIYDKLPWRFWSKVIYLEIPGMEISSSLIRQRLRQDKSIKYLVPEVIQDYILKNKIYGE